MLKVGGQNYTIAVINSGLLDDMESLNRKSIDNYKIPLALNGKTMEFKKYWKDRK